MSAQNSNVTMPTFVVEVPDDIVGDEELVDWVQENTELFYPAMDLDASQYDDRATVDEVNITNVEINTETVAIEYEYEYSVYYGCRDMNYSGVAPEDVIVGRRQGHSIIFEKYTAPGRRSTLDEF